jgi:hypothetical protein
MDAESIKEKTMRCMQRFREEDPMTTEEMKEKKRMYGLTAEMISRASGVPLGTVQKIFSGTTKAPRKLTMDAIEKVFREEEAKRNGLFAGLNAPGSILREESGRYGAAKRQELHTLDDYYALPEDIRAELIDGTFYNMGAPTRRHQLILGEMYLQLKGVRRNMKCPARSICPPATSAWTGMTIPWFSRIFWQSVIMRIRTCAASKGHRIL